MSEKRFYPVSGQSVSGKFKVRLIKFLFFIIHLIKGKKWSNPIESFEENPLYFTMSDVIYLGYKYYFKPPETGDSHKKLPLKNGSILKDKIQLKIHIGGDLMPYESLMGGKGRALWEVAGDDFFGADLVMANLETPMDFSAKSGFVPEVMVNDMLFNGTEDLMQVFTGNGKYSYDFLTIANNHMLDAGHQGLMNTMKFLDDKGIMYTGAKKSESEKDYKLIDLKGVRLGISSFTYSLNRVVPDSGKETLVNYIRLNQSNVDLSRLTLSLREARKAGSDLVIASLHMGNAYQCYPTKNIRDQAKRIFEEGAPDVMIIHHPHNLQPAERIAYVDRETGKEKEGVVYYSLGDFIAYDIFNWSHLTGYATLNVVTDENKKIHLYPSFEYLYLYRDKNGNLKFIPWETAMKDARYHDDKFKYLFGWYDRHAKYFFE